MAKIGILPHHFQPVRTNLYFGGKCDEAQCHWKIYKGVILELIVTQELKYCRTKAIKPSAQSKWEDAEDALHEASPNNMHRFLNWCLKLEYNPDGRHLEGYGKASSLDADWKYFRIYYTRQPKAFIIIRSS